MQSPSLAEGPFFEAREQASRTDRRTASPEDRLDASAVSLEIVAAITVALAGLILNGRRSIGGLRREVAAVRRDIVDRERSADRGATS